MVHADKYQAHWVPNLCTRLKKLAAQEKEIDALTARQKALMTDEFQARKKYEDYLTTISD